MVFQFFLQKDQNLNLTTSSVKKSAKKFSVKKKETGKDLLCNKGRNSEKKISSWNCRKLVKTPNISVSCLLITDNAIDSIAVMIVIFGLSYNR